MINSIARLGIENMRKCIFFSVLRELRVVSDRQDVVREAVEIGREAVVTLCEWGLTLIIADGQRVVAIPGLEEGTVGTAAQVGPVHGDKLVSEMK